MNFAELTAFLAPLLPFLLSSEQNTPEQAIAKFGQPTWQTATVVWGTLQPYLSSKPDLQTAIAQCAAKPDSAARKAVLQEELTTLLSEHPTLTTAIAQVLQANSPGQAAGIPSNQMSGGTVAGTVQGAMFNISGSSITNLTGAGDTYYQEAPNQPNPLNPNFSQAVER